MALFVMFNLDLINYYMMYILMNYYMHAYVELLYDVYVYELIHECTR